MTTSFLTRTLTASIAALTMAGCAAYSEAPSSRVGQATLSYANGLPAGSAQLYLTGNGELRLSAAFAGLSDGMHGFHLHTTGTCTAPGFQSAGGHLNPAGREHGTDNPAGSHLGDLPNITAASDGTASASATIAVDGTAALQQIFDGDGTAIVVHANADDYRTDPAGDAGPRVACGVVTPA